MLLVFIALMVYKSAKVLPEAIYSLVDSTPYIGHKSMVNTLYLYTSFALLAPLLSNQSGVSAVICCLFIFTLGCISFVDSVSGYICDRFHVLILLLYVLSKFMCFDYANFYNELKGALAIVLLLEAANALSILLFKQVGIGGGDVKLCFVSTLMLGIHNIVFSLFIAFTVSLIYILFFNAKNNNQIALAPFLCTPIALLYCLTLL